MVLWGMMNGKSRGPGNSSEDTEREGVGWGREMIQKRKQRGKTEGGRENEGWERKQCRASLPDRDSK